MRGKERRRAAKRKRREKRLRTARNVRRNLPELLRDEPWVDPEDELDDDPPSPFFMERELLRMARAVAGQADDELDARARAQELAFQALEAPSPASARTLAREALALDPDCVDALSLLAHLEVTAPRARILPLRAAVAAGERSLGPAFIAEHTGVLRSFVQARPYLRARAWLAEALRAAGDLPGATAEYEAVRRLDQDDGQGVRFDLLSCLFEAQDQDGVRRLLAELPEEEFAVVRWARVLERFAAGDRHAAARLFRRAQRENRFAAATLTGEIAVDPRPVWRAGGTSEAAEVVRHLGRAWSRTPGALEWLRQDGPATTPQERERARASYAPPLDALLSRGEPAFGSLRPWAEDADLRLDVAHARELLRMATDPALWEASDASAWAPIRAWRAFVSAPSDEGVLPLIDLVDDRADDDWVLEDLPRVLGSIGAAVWEPMEALLEEWPVERASTTIAAQTLGHLARLHPEHREAVVALLLAHLARYEENAPLKNSLLIEELLQLEAAEAASLLVRARAEGPIDEDFAPTQEELEEELRERGWL